MATTYTLISSNVLSSSAASVTFSSIPGTYTDLVVRASIRTTVGSSVVDVTFNSSTSSYSSTILTGNGSTTSSSRQSNTTEFQVSNVSSTNTANTFSSVEIYVPSYLVSQNKPVSHFGVTENNATSAIIRPMASLWSNTSAITSITFTYSNIASDSSFYLYGIKNS
jgi:hypothetical protein